MLVTSTTFMVQIAVFSETETTLTWNIIAKVKKIWDYNKDKYLY